MLKCFNELIRRRVNAIMLESMRRCVDASMRQRLKKPKRQRVNALIRQTVKESKRQKVNALIR